MARGGGPGSITSGFNAAPGFLRAVVFLAVFFVTRFFAAFFLSLFFFTAFFAVVFFRAAFFFVTFFLTAFLAGLRIADFFFVLLPLAFFGIGSLLQERIFVDYDSIFSA
jgi:hypothetical protein